MTRFTRGARGKGGKAPTRLETQVLGGLPAGAIPVLMPPCGEGITHANQLMIRESRRNLVVIPSHERAYTPVAELLTPLDTIAVQ